MDCEKDAVHSSVHLPDAPGTPPVNPPPSVRRRSRKQWPQSLYLMYSHHRMSNWSDSSYKIELPSPSSSNSAPSSSPEPTALSPTLVFPDDARFPRDMSCTRLGSKVYFLGGQVTSHGVVPEGVFPSDVHVLDLGGAGPEEKLLTLGAPMNAGKPSPVVFAAQGKVFALGSAVMMNFIELPSVSYLDFVKQSAAMAGKSFECYDPKDARWRVLEEPPVDRLTSWVDCSVLEGHGLVLAYGWQGGSRHVQLLYDIRRGTWAQLGRPDCYYTSTTTTAATSELDRLGRSSSYSLYGINAWGLPFKCKLEMADVMDDSDPIPRVVGDPGDIDTSAVIVSTSGRECKASSSRLVFRDPFLESVFQVHSLGDGYFCHVVSGALGRPEGPDQWGDLPPDPCSRGVRVTVFKEIHGNDTDGQFDQGKVSFGVEVLYSKQYLIRTASYSMAKLVSGFVVSHDQLRKMKKNAKRNIRKKNVDEREDVAKGGC